MSFDVRGYVQFNEAQAAQRLTEYVKEKHGIDKPVFMAEPIVERDAVGVSQCTYYTSSPEGAFTVKRVGGIKYYPIDTGWALMHKPGVNRSFQRQA